MNIIFATFLLVFLRGIQQQNVIHGHYLTAAITPFAIAAAEVAMILWVVDIGWPAVPYVGLGGSLGITSSMYVHKKVFKR